MIKIIIIHYNTQLICVQKLIISRAKYKKAKDFYIFNGLQQQAYQLLYKVITLLHRFTFLFRFVPDMER